MPGRSLSTWVRCLVVVLATIAASACSFSSPAITAKTSGFGATTAVVEPYADGRQQMVVGNYGLAIERFHRALSLDRRSVRALNGLGVAYAKLGRHDHAARYFEQALELDPQSGISLNNYGRLLLAQGDYRRARSLLQAAKSATAETERSIVEGNLAIVDRELRAKPGLQLTKGETRSSDKHGVVRVGRSVQRLKLIPSPGTPLPLPASYGSADALAKPPRRPSKKTLLPPGLQPYVVVANGTGTSGLARRWKERFASEGLRVSGLDNCDGYGRKRTQIVYRPLFQKEAERFAASLPITVEVRAVTDSVGDVRIELGDDAERLLGETSLARPAIPRKGATG